MSDEEVGSFLSIHNITRKNQDVALISGTFKKAQPYTRENILQSSKSEGNVRSFTLMAQVIGISTIFSI